MMCRERSAHAPGTAAVWLVLVATLFVATPALAQEGEWGPPIHDDQWFWKVLFEQLEYANGTDHDPISWDAKIWIGGDFNRAFVKTEGGRSTNRRGSGEFEVQGLYSRLISPFWEMRGGVRVDRQLGEEGNLTRVHAAFGFDGLAPYWIELEPFIFVSADGDISGRIEAKYDLLLTQRLVLQPDVEVNLAVQSVEEWGVGSGLVDTSVALRLRYEIRRELAPYLGIEWAQRFGETADLSRDAGERVAEWSVLVGLGFWF